MEYLAKTDDFALQEEETNDNVRHDVEEKTADASPSVVDDEEDSPSASEKPRPLSYTLLNLTEQHAWDNVMSQLVPLERALNSQVEEALQNSEELLRQVQVLCDQIETYPCLIKVHSEFSPCLLQRLCVGKSSVLSRLFEDEHHEDDALEIVKRLIDQNPEALLWTKVLPEQGEEQETSAQVENTPILKDLLVKFPKLGLFILEQHRSIFDSEYQGDLVASIVTNTVCRFGCSTTILGFLHSFPHGLFCQYQTLYPIQVINRRVWMLVFDAIVGGRAASGSHVGIGFVLLGLLKADSRIIQHLNPNDHFHAAFGLMWSSLASPGELLTEDFLQAATTMFLKPMVSNPTTFNYGQFSSLTMLPIFIMKANERARQSPSTFKFLKTVLRMNPVSDSPFKKSALELDVVLHLLPLIEKEQEIEQEYVKLRQVRAILDKTCVRLDEKEVENEEESEDSPLVGFLQGLYGWAKERLEGCPPRIRAIRAEMNQLPDMESD